MQGMEAHPLKWCKEQVRLVDGLDVEIVTQLRPDACQQVVEHMKRGLALCSPHHSRFLEQVKLHDGFN